MSQTLHTSHQRRARALLLVLTLAVFAIPAGAAIQSDTQLLEVPDDVYWEPNSSLVGPQGLVDALVVDGTDLYVGGHFEQIGGQPIHHLARWDGAQWNEIGGGVGMPTGGLVHRIIVDGNKVYAAGCFTVVGGMLPVCNIAMWDGTMWDMMGGGTNRAVRAIAIGPNGDLFVGGEFTMVGGPGGIMARGIARWDGQQWHALGTGIDNHVSSIAVRGNSVFIGGAFRTAGGKAANFVARWDGTDWQTLATGVNNLVTALATTTTDVYVGGMFSRADGRPASRIARWAGGRWFDMGGGVSGPGAAAVREIYVDGDYLYVGGFFRWAGGAPANYVAMWDGTQWGALGSGTDFSVKCFARSGSDMMYVGGEFRSAGGKTSNYLAHWTRSEPVPVYFLGFFADLVDNAVKLRWNVSYDEPIAGFRIYRSRAGDAVEEALNDGRLLPTTTRDFTDERISGGTDYRYVVGAVRPDGSEIRSRVIAVETPEFSVILEQNHPNPFNPATTVRFALPRQTRVTLTIYDARGARVRTLVDGVRPAGINQASWNGLNEQGSRATTGVYFYRLQAGNTALTRKMTLLK